MRNSGSPTPLAPPGAGIPAIERLVGGTFLKLRVLLGTPAKFTAHFQRERTTIADRCAGRDARVLAARVLIPRLRGLEDSSRFWSVWMTLDHLRIVNDSIADVIRDLLQGRVPKGVASTAAVKPSEHVGPEVVATYDASCDRLIQLVASPSMRRTELRYAHPWFGPLDAAGWHALSAMHMGIHRGQVDRILRAVARRDS